MEIKLIVRNFYFIALFTALSGASSLTARAADSFKLGIVDMQRVLQTVKPGKEAKSQLEKEFNSKKEKLQAEESAIKKLTENFKKQSSVMSDEARAKKQAELQDRYMKFQETTARSQMEIQQKERDLTQPIINHIREVIAKIAEDKKYNLVLEKNENTVLYSEEKDDLTSEVISNYDKVKTSSKGA